MRYCKKPVVIDAFQLPQAGDNNVEPFLNWAESVGFTNWTSDRDEGLAIETLEGVMRADPGDYIIKGVKGEFYPCKPDIFAATYEHMNLLTEDQLKAAAREYCRLMNWDPDTQVMAYDARQFRLIDETYGGTPTASRPAWSWAMNTVRHADRMRVALAVGAQH